MTLFPHTALSLSCRHYRGGLGVTFSRVFSTPRLNHSPGSSPMKRSLSETHDSPDLKRPRRDMAVARIILTPRETQLRELLLDVARYIDESKKIKEKIELRFAGGWVRDKLLGIPSHDIDTAINAMTGFAFSTEMQEYLKDEKNLEKHSLEATDVHNLHKILANPEKSKHLETATTKIFDFDVDFVNLRKETYSEDSRNPQMEFGTAEEDAIRRDATINSLFYNLHSDQIEDFTGGLEDLAAKHIRTPLEPRTTFMDDPLRVLRLIRFASRLKFTIDAEAEAQMGDPDVRDALKLKISRERVGVEVEKMLKDHNPRTALEFFDRLNLYSTIFTDPTMKICPAPDASNWRIVYEGLEKLATYESPLKADDGNPKSLYNSLVTSKDENYLSWILAALTPWSTIEQKEPIRVKGKPPLLLGAMVAREGIKAENKICNVVNGAFKNFEEIISLKDAVKYQISEDHMNCIISESNKFKGAAARRDVVGMTIRRWDSQGGHWRLQVLFAILVEMARLDVPVNIKDLSIAYSEIFEEWRKFIDHLEVMEVMDAPTVKPKVTGGQLCEALGGIRPGPWMKRALEVCMEWQFVHPEEEDITGAVGKVRSMAEELGIPL